MLELSQISVHADHRGTVLLEDIAFRTGWNHLCAVLGPSGCGKSTLLKAIAGVIPIDDGHLYWRGRDLCDREAHEEFEPGECGYVPQFSIAYEELTVEENIEAALRLRRAGMRRHEQEEAVEAILDETGLADLADRRVGLISGGQRRRLSLAMELTSRPAMLLCDELTSGLDPKAESDMLKLLGGLARDGKRVVLNVTHSLQHLELYDSVLVLAEGRVAYHGMPAHLLHYFQIETFEELYDQLNKRSADAWHRSWQKHGETYYRRAGAKNPAFAFEAKAPSVERAADPDDTYKPRLDDSDPPPVEDAPTILAQEPAPSADPEEAWGNAPGVLGQTGILLGRRFRIFLRDRAQLAIQLAMLIGFPLLVAIFALDGLPQINNAPMELGGVLEAVKANADLLQTATTVGGLISGLVMFQVILLALMGANNGAREIAGERLIMEKEKLAGLSPVAYVLSKMVFTGIIAVIQAAAMTLIVQYVCRFEGDVVQRFAVLALVALSMTYFSLGISALSSSAEKASLLAIYFVGFQLPLSGAVLALPAPLDVITRPFIAAYWGWSGVLQSMKETRFYEMVDVVSQTALSGLLVCIWFLALQALVGIVIALIGSRRVRWD